MNFLAHAHLSGSDEKILLGNFIGDFVKGRQALQKFPPGIIRGVELHRSIDEFTDKHPVVLESKKRLRSKYRHYAGVIVDVFYDHFLAANWTSFHPKPLADFASETYKIVEMYHDVLPEGVKYMMPYMISGNWLVSYAKIEGIHRALSGMARRTSYPSGMEHAVDDLRKDYDLFLAEFKEFFPLLKAHAGAFIEKLNDQSLA
jgi:acyl carrier protein phosphodiesterase